VDDDGIAGADVPAYGGFFADDSIGEDAALLGPASLAERLRDLEVRYRGLIDHLPAVLYVDGVGDDDTMVDVSPGIETLLGITREEWLSEFLAWTSIVHPEDRERVERESERCVATGERYTIEYRARHRDGRDVWIREDATLIHHDDGTPAYWLGVMLDVTELVTTQRELHETRTKYGALVEQIPAIVYVDLDDMSTTYVSPQIRDLLGVTPQEYCEDPHLWERLLHPDDHDRALEEYLRGRASGEPFTFEYRLVGRDDRVVWFRDSAIVLTDAQGEVRAIQGVMLDITERKAAEEQIAFLAYHDKLTGLPNRAMFDELLELAIARARRHGLGVAVVSLDLDNFKLINDSLGHECGDALITELAERLREATRETDLVARPGGDEFLLLLADLDLDLPPGGGPDAATTVAESVAVRVQQALATPFELGEHEVYVSASMGLSLFPSDAADAAALIQHADTAMFHSKQQGPGGFVLHRSDEADALSKLSLSTRLRKAVEGRSWMLHYQPLIELLTGRMYGVEALIRWPEPNGGLVPPGEFIPLAEEMGLIEAIGDWVVEELCAQEERWRAEGLVVEVGFNLSPRQLWSPELVEKIVSHVMAAGTDPTRVMVEITESAAMTDPDRTMQILRDLHDRGLRLAIDDFGTGYSSLARLKHMPVDVLKIDRSFIRNAHEDPQNASMVSAMIALASNLGMTALAEGVETDEERRFLVDRGCELGQGYFFSKPIPADEVLARWRRSSLQVVQGSA
jgi:diguanylate cyclase (GGDEF)-like protein/PAS domain S-box-containing protein